MRETYEFRRHGAEPLYGTGTLQSAQSLVALMNQHRAINPFNLSPAHDYDGETFKIADEIARFGRSDYQSHEWRPPGVLVTDAA